MVANTDTTYLDEKTKEKLEYWQRSIIEARLKWVNVELIHINVDYV